VVSRNLNLIDELIRKGDDVNITDDKGMTPLHHAVDSSDICVVKLLLAQRSNVNAKDQNGWTPLHYAVKAQDTYIVQILIKQKECDVNAKDNDGWTPLYWAIQYNSSDVFEELLQTKNIDINCWNNKDQTPLHLAVISKKSNIVQLLINHSANCNVYDIQYYTPLHYAVRDRNHDITNMLVDLSNVNAYNYRYQTPWSMAINTKDSELLKFLFKSEQNSNAINISDIRGNTPLHYAVLVQDLEMVRMCLDKKARPNLQNRYKSTPLHYALSKQGNSSEIIAELLNYEVSFTIADNDGNTPLHLLASNITDVEIVKKLLSNSTERFYETLNHQQLTATMIAHNRKNHETFKQLITKILDQNTGIKYQGEEIVITKFDQSYIINLGNNDRYIIGSNNLSIEKCLRPSMTYYISSKDISTIRRVTEIEKISHPNHIAHCFILSKNGMNIDKFSDEDASKIKPSLTQLDYFGNSALHLSIYYSSYGVIKQFIDMLREDKKDPNQYLTHIHNNTILHLAVATNRIDVVKILVNKDYPNIYYVNSNGNTPLHLAAASNHYKIINYLLKYNPLNAENSIIASNINQYTPLKVAILSGSLQSVEELFNEDSTIHDQSDQILELATSKKTVKVLEFLLNKTSVSMAETKHVPLLKALRSKNVEVSEFLLKKYQAEGVPVDDPMKAQMLYHAIRHNMQDIIKMLIDEFNADVMSNTPTNTGVQSLLFAVRDVSTIALCIHSITKPEDCDKALLFFIENLESPQIIKLLLEHKTILMDCNPSTLPLVCELSNGNTLWHLAVLHKRLDIIHILMKYQGNVVNNKNNDGNAPLHLSLLANDVEDAEKYNTIKSLIFSTPTNINEANKDGNTPLHLAIKCNCPVIASILIDQYYNNAVLESMLNAQNQDLDTPLHLAIKSLDIMTVKNIMRHRDQVNQKIVDKDDHTVLDLARERQETEIYDCVLNPRDPSLLTESSELSVISGLPTGIDELTPISFGQTGIDGTNENMSYVDNNEHDQAFIIDTSDNEEEMTHADDEIEVIELSDDEEEQHAYPLGKSSYEESQDESQIFYISYDQDVLGNNSIEYLDV